MGPRIYVATNIALFIALSYVFSSHDNPGYYTHRGSLREAGEFPYGNSGLKAAFSATVILNMFAASLYCLGRSCLPTVTDKPMTQFAHHQQPKQDVPETRHQGPRPGRPADTQGS